MIKKDILTRQDIQKIVNSFYQKVQFDDLLGPIFDHFDIDWSLHLSKMYDFWDSIIFTSGLYKGNPLSAHIMVTDQIKLSETHFEKWLEIFNETIDEFYQGEKAELIKKRAGLMSKFMYSKIKNYNEENILYAN